MVWRNDVMQLTTGQYRSAGQIFGSYRCLALLGEGGMGHVYLAEHIRLGRKVALKRLKDRVAAEPEAVAQFMTEAQAVNRIHHPHIVDITDFCDDDAGVYYLMELLEGSTVAEVLREHGPLSERRVLYIGHQMADALEAAHRADVLHLDIKPSNIFLQTRDGQADYGKLLDFGIARLRDAAVRQSPEGQSEADPGADMGPVTPAFMAPEQATTRPVDHRTDIYSLGAVLYAMLAGRPPFEAQSLAEFVHKHLSVEPTPLARLKDLPERISVPCSRLVMRCLSKRPADRPQSARELRDLLARVAEVSCGIRLVPGHPPETAPKRLGWRRIGIAAGLVMLVLGAVAVFFALRNTEADTSRRGAASGSDMNARATSGPQTSGRLTLRLLSTPSGAEVYREDGTRRLLGLTPLLVSDLPAADNVMLRLKRSGYDEQLLTVDLTGGSKTMRVKMVPVMGAGRPMSPAPRPRGPRTVPPKRGPRVRPRAVQPTPEGSRPRPRVRAMGSDTAATVNPFDM